MLKSCGRISQAKSTCKEHSEHMQSLCTHILSDAFVALQDERPSYKALQGVLMDTEGSSSGKTWVERIRAEFAFNRDSLDDYRR